MQGKAPASRPRISPAWLIAALAAGLLIAGALLLPATSSQAAGPVVGQGKYRAHLPFLVAGQAAQQATPTATASQTTEPTETPEATHTPSATASPTATTPPLNTSHAGRFTVYEGSKTCMGCHAQQTKDAHGSIHYQWNAPAPYANLSTATAGKLGAINDFCGYPDINWLSVLTDLDGQPTDGGCATCHGGMGLRPSKEQSDAQLGNVDCLMCHSATYKRKVVNDGGVFKLVPAPERMSVPLAQAITDIKKPTKANCLNCHLSSGGGPNNKRGDLEPAHSDPPRSLDVHMASKANGGAGLVCQSCHVTQNHRIAGRGSDMRGTDLDQPVKCVNCHAQKPHGNSNIDKHTAKVECSVCHVPAFARITSTDMVRDFREVEVYQARRLYEPKITRQANVIPQVAWFNGTSKFYEFGTPAMLGPNGRVIMSQPVGGVNDAKAKLFAFKYHQAEQARDPVTGRILPMKMGILFQDGNVDLAVRKGVEAVGWTLPQGYDWVPTERLLSINHEVAPHEQALKCDTCHANNATRLDWAKLGYTPKSTRNGKPLCESCHEKEDEDWSNFFYGVHDKHVKDKKIACAECHNFSR